MRWQALKTRWQLWLVALAVAMSLALLPNRPAAADPGALPARFEAVSLDNRIQLSWTDGGAAGQVGFNLYRGTNFQASGVPLNTAPIAPLESTPARPAIYQWQDFDVEKGETYYYWVETLRAVGDSDLHGPIGVLHESPTAIVLSSVSGASSAATLPWLALSLAAIGGAIAFRRRRP